MITFQLPPRDVLITAADGIALRAWHWGRPKPRGVLVIAHGFGEHGGCYRHVAEALGPALEIDVVAPDLRGHGRSPGRRGVVGTYDDLVSDLRSATAWARRARAGLPLYLLGHSNGGQLALRLALEKGHSLAGLIVSNPSLRLATQVPRSKLAIGRLLLRFAPRMTLSAKLEAELLTRDSEMQREHQTDPLRHSRISAPYFFGMTEGGPNVSARSGSIATPTLMLLGAADPVVDPEESRLAFERLGSIDKTLMIYPKMLHEPLNEVGREQVFADLRRWLELRLGAAAESA
jgi:alpha-beta hydrolase superfamily lysophospholipase